MKELGVVHVGVPLKSLSRVNRTIRGSHAGSLWEVDTTHNVAYENVLSKDIITIKQLHNVYESGLYVCDRSSLRVFGGQQIVGFSEASALTGQFAGGTNDLLITRYHHKHSKYSINVMNLHTKEQRIAKLLDQYPAGLLYDEPGKSTSATATFECEDFVHLLDLEKGKLTNQQKGSLLSDENYMYITDRLETRAMDRHTHKKQFEFESKRRPLRIETFHNDVMVGSEFGIEFFDFRKLTRLVSFAPISHMQDFLHDPNIERMFVTSHSELTVLSL